MSPDNTQCEYYSYFGNQRPGRELECEIPATGKVFYTKANQNISVCNKHGRRVRAANASRLAAIQRSSKPRGSTET
jgi:hypothetical protein